MILTTRRRQDTGQSSLMTLFAAALAASCICSPGSATPRSGEPAVQTRAESAQIDSLVLSADAAYGRALAVGTASRIGAAFLKLQGERAASAIDDSAVERDSYVEFPSRSSQVPLQTMPFWMSSEENMYSTGMIWRDCNGDGVIDVFFSNGNDIVQAPNMIYLSDSGRLPYSASWYSSNMEYSGHCAVGDINDDGFPDFVVSNYLGIGWGQPNRSDFYVNQGYLPDTSPIWYTPDSIFSFSCALGDVDGDGDLDIAFATGEGYRNDLQPDLLYLNEDGLFSGVAAWQSVSATAAMDVTWGDVDNDGDLDLAFCYGYSPTAVFYNSEGVLETTPSWQAGTTESGNTLIFGDVNDDGWLDLVVAYNNQFNGDGYHRVYFNNGTGALNPVHGWQSHDGGYGSALALYDYDSDGDDDLAAGRWFDQLKVYMNLGDSFTSAPVWSTDVQVIAEELAWVDIDGGSVVTMADTFAAEASRRLFYTQQHPLYALDSIIVDGTPLGRTEYCYDLVSGWASLSQTPVSEVVLCYRYSHLNDLTVANWGMINMAFANTTVDFYAEGTFGPVPLTVQFSDSSTGADGWHWLFGDGASSYEQNPSYEYLQPGLYTVLLTINTPQRQYTRSIAGMVSAHADTLKIESSRFGPGSTARVEVCTHNFLPLTRMTIALSYGGPIDLKLDSVSTSGLRTEYMGAPSVLAADPAGKRVAFRLTADASAPLDAGDGAVVSLYFHDQGSSTTGTNPIWFASYGSHSNEFLTHAGSYIPGKIDGSLGYECCKAQLGNIDGSESELPDIGDLQFLIDHLYIGMEPLDCVDEADLDLSGQPYPTPGDIDITDLQRLVDNLFISMDPLPACPSE